MWELKKFEHNLAVIEDSGEKTTYGQLAQYCEMLKKNIPERCLIFNLCSNTLGSLIGYVCFLNSKIVPLMLDAHLDKDLLHHFIQTYRPDYLWVPTEQNSHFDGKVVFQSWDYTLLKRSDEHIYPLYDDLALLLTTSGSTGSPKFVRQSYNNILSNTQSIAKYLKLNETERPITTLPMNYTYGLSILNSHLFVGATILLTDKTLMQREFWDFFTAAPLLFWEK